MERFTRNGVEITMPEMDAEARLNMERCADFMARMILKYGREIQEEKPMEKTNQ